MCVCVFLFKPSACFLTHTHHSRLPAEQFPSSLGQLRLDLLQQLPQLGILALHLQPLADPLPSLLHAAHLKQTPAPAIPGLRVADLLGLDAALGVGSARHPVVQLHVGLGAVRKQHGGLVAQQAVGLPGRASQGHAEAEGVVADGVGVFGGFEGGVACLAELGDLGGAFGVDGDGGWGDGGGGRGVEGGEEGAVEGVEGFEFGEEGAGLRVRVGGGDGFGFGVHVEGEEGEGFFVGHGCCYLGFGLVLLGGGGVKKRRGGWSVGRSVGRACLGIGRR